MHASAICCDPRRRRQTKVIVRGDRPVYVHACVQLKCALLPVVACLEALLSLEALARLAQAPCGSIRSCSAGPLGPAWPTGTSGAAPTTSR